MTGDILTLEEDALYAFKEYSSYPAFGQLPLARPHEPVIPVAVIRGSTEISTCGAIELSARGSTGSGGRDMVYSWTVCGGPGDLSQVDDSRCS